MHKVKELKVYQKGLRLTKLIRATTRSFPSEELFVLTAQFRRAADSVVLNLAEGAGNSSLKEFSRFLDYSIRSGFECMGCADIALENELLTPPSRVQIHQDVNEIIAMLDGLKKSLTR